jgi:hypothetical protein
MGNPMKERDLAEQFLRDHVLAARVLVALQLNQLPEAGKVHSNGFGELQHISRRLQTRSGRRGLDSGAGYVATSVFATAKSGRADPSSNPSPLYWRSL